MMILARQLTTLLTLLALIAASFSGASAAPAGPPDAAGPTPPRLSYVDGEASFWRPGAADWAPAQLNTPLGAGDELFTGHPGNIELQVGPRAFVRAWGDTQLGLANLESDFLQLKITTGHVAVDLRTVEPGRTVEIDTPTGAFMVAHPGYYRVDVAPDRTSFITRRGGQATLTSASGQALAIASSEDVLLDASGAAQTYVAPEPDSWDSW